ncbi:uncharacterized protein LOC116175312 [Photinus pyralis]|uniref:Uncharacterized protein n=1 Tax=Photinus pyralis TaxID=7054 RepID=A0A1Y1KXK0_PHOPY|nr:uncharacterized protein LOC116175312 [Photinus pyralis]
MDQVDADHDDDHHHDHPYRIYIIIAVVVGAIILQIVGVLICCKDRWKTKRKAKKAASLRESNTGEITKVVSIVKETKKGKTLVETADEEAQVALLASPLEGGNRRSASIEEDPESEIHIHTNIIKVKHIIP